MKIEELKLFEMPYFTGKDLSTQFSPYTLSDESKYFILDMDDEFSLYLDDEDKPASIKIGTLKDNGGILIIGEFDIGYEQFKDLPPKTIVTHIIRINKEYLSKGLGSKCFKTLLDNGFSILSDTIHFNGAYYFWNKLIKNQKQIGVNVYLFKKGELQMKNGTPYKITYRSNKDNIWGDTTDRLLITKHVY